MPKFGGDPSGGFLVVLPVLTRTYADPCIQSVIHPRSSSGFKPEDVLIVDNSLDGFCQEAYGDSYGFPVYRDPDGHNLGVGRAWNVGAQAVMDRHLDYLVLMSVAMQFGPYLHTDWVEQMGRFWGHPAIECDGHSWHLIAIHRGVFETVGLFDPAFYPAYVEAIDFGYRMRQHNLEGAWPRCWVNALSQSVAGHIDVVTTPQRPLLAYYAEKWGGAKGEETFTLPWKDQPIDTVTDEPIPVLAKRYGLGEQGREWW